MSAYELARTLVQPSHALMLLAVLGLLLLVLRWRRTGLGLSALGLGGLLVTGVLPVGAYLAQGLEARHPRPTSPPARVDGILVLGGFTAPDATCADRHIRLNDAAERLLEVLVLARRYPDARLVISGGGWAFAQGCSEAEQTARFLARYGFDMTRLELETRSRNTFENALFTYRQVRPQPDEVWLLVTSAVHMPRAVAVFERVGWRVVPWPVDFIGTDTLWHLPAVIDLPRRWRELDLVAHEVLGLLWYRWRGRIAG